MSSTYCIYIRIALLAVMNFVGRVSNLYSSAAEILPSSHQTAFKVNGFSHNSGSIFLASQSELRTPSVPTNQKEDEFCPRFKLFYHSILHVQIYFLYVFTV